MANKPVKTSAPEVDSAPANETPVISVPDAQKVAAEILAKVDETILVKELPADYTDDFTGIAKNDPAHAKKHVPQDHIPGTKMLDALHVPEYAYDDDRHVVRRVSLPGEYHYIWVEATDVDRFKHNGYRFCLYDGGNGSGLAHQGLSGTYLYDRTLTNRVMRGDVYLMYAPMRLYAEIVRNDEEMAQKFRSMGHNNFHNIAYRYGLRSFHAVESDVRATQEQKDEAKLLYN